MPRYRYFKHLGTGKITKVDVTSKKGRHKAMTYKRDRKYVEVNSKGKVIQ